jgi:hypothetical protein
MLRIEASLSLTAGDPLDHTNNRKPGKLVFDPDDGSGGNQHAIALCRRTSFGEERYGVTAFRVDQKQLRGNISYDHQPGGGLDQRFGGHRKRLA